MYLRALKPGCQFRCHRKLKGCIARWPRPLQDLHCIPHLISKMCVFFSSAEAQLHLFLPSYMIATIRRNYIVYGTQLAHEQSSLFLQKNALCHQITEPNWRGEAIKKTMDGKKNMKHITSCDHACKWAMSYLYIDTQRPRIYCSWISIRTLSGPV